MIDVSPVEKIVLQILLGDPIRGFVIELNEHAHGTGVSFLGALAFAVELEGLNGFLVPIFHHGRSPVVKGNGSPGSSADYDRRTELT